MADDSRVRMAAFEFLEQMSVLYGDVVPRSVLLAGFTFEGKRIPLAGPQGIFKPAVLAEIPLSITTAPIVEGKQRPYDDEIGEDGLIRYRYRGTDPGHWENVGLREAMRTQTPLIHLYGVVPGQYVPVWPVFLVGDDPAALDIYRGCGREACALRRPPRRCR